MFITSTRSGYNRSGEQVASGQFLALFSDVLNDKTIEGPDGKRYAQVYALVRRCALSQLGHWMMGSIRVRGTSITMSGCYGSDGLTCGLDKLPTPWPDDLYRLTPEECVAYWTGEGGHNSAGSEAPAMRAIGTRLAARRSSTAIRTAQTWEW